MMESGKNREKSKEVLSQFSDIIIDRRQNIKDSHWEQGWIPINSVGFPTNLSGRHYSGSNAMFLLMHNAEKNYGTPVYLTFNQAKELDLKILKGEKAFPVVYWNFVIKDGDGNKLTKEEYSQLSEEEKEKCDVRPFMKTYPVFNLDQTDFKTLYPEKYQNLVDKYHPTFSKDTTGMYVNNALDRMIEKQEWVCPIEADMPAEGAFYNKKRDFIAIPMKSQFVKSEDANDLYVSGQEYYATLLHEMAHSTMTEGRLKRNTTGVFGDTKYAKEELIAELTAALVGSTIGFDKKISDNSVRYVDHWIKTLKEEPRFVSSLMSDINKASDMIFEYVDRQKLALGEEPYIPKHDSKVAEQLNQELADKKQRIDDKTRVLTGSEIETNVAKRGVTDSKQNMSKFDFIKELKSKVGVDDIAFALGYRLDKKAGVGKYFEMVLGNGSSIQDKLIIRNTSDKSSQTYFRRDGSTGDVITLIRDNINHFNVSGKNEWDTVTRVMAQYANMPIETRNEEYESIKSGQKHKVFDPSRYDIKPIDLNNVPKLLELRGFDKRTIETFSPFIGRIKDNENKAYSGYNIGFPYTDEQGVTGYEIRGYGGFKSKASGTDSSKALWVADLTNGCTSMVNNVYLFESAFDAMAFYQMNREKLSRDTALVSVGGTFSDKQIMSVMHRFPNARLNDCFDNDIAGRVNAIRMISVSQKLPMSISKDEEKIELTVKGNKIVINPKESIIKQLNDYIPGHNLGEATPDKRFKDWNDCLLGISSEVSIAPNKYDRNEKLAERRKTSFKI